MLERSLLVVLLALAGAEPAVAAFTSEVRSAGNAGRAAATFKPRAVAAPTITGETRVGGSLTAEDGQWDRDPDSLIRVWLRCGPDGEACAAIPDASGSTYAVSPDDLRARIRLQVTGTNAGGATTARSAATTTIEAIRNSAPPANTVSPSISGATTIDGLLTANAGTWTGHDNAYTYQWLRCTSSTSCDELAGETAATYRIDGADLDAAFRVRVTARNDGGATTATSATTSAATRNSFTYVACADPSTGLGVGPINGTPPPGFSRYTTGNGATTTSLTWRCGAGERAPEMRQALKFNTTTPKAGIRFRYDVPANLTMVGGDLWRAVSLVYPLGSTVTTTPGGDAYGSRSSDCWHNFGCRTRGTSAAPFDPSNKVSLGPSSPDGFGFTLHCHTLGDPCSTSGWNAIYGATIALQDTASPTLAAPATGTLLTSPTLEANETITLDARDAGSGLYNVRVRIDDAEVATRVIPDASCADVDPSNADAYEFASHTPCPASYRGTLAFDTTGWPRGTRRLHVVLEDAGRNTVTLVRRRVVVGA